jgi:hypothetical protein
MGKVFQFSLNIAFIMRNIYNKENLWLVSHRKFFGRRGSKPASSKISAWVRAAVSVDLYGESVFSSV